MKNYQELSVWKNSISLYAQTTKLIIRLKEEKYYRLSDQVEASCGSISDNIAEGFGRGGNKEFIQFLYIAKGSSNEFANQIERVNLLGKISSDEKRELKHQTEIVSKQLTGLITYLKNTDQKGPKFQ